MKIKKACHGPVQDPAKPSTGMITPLVKLKTTRRTAKPLWMQISTAKIASGTTSVPCT